MKKLNYAVFFMLMFLFALSSTAFSQNAKVDRAKKTYKPVQYNLSPKFIQPSSKAAYYDNGPIVNSPGTGAGGADESVLQTGLGLSTFGFGHAQSSGYRVADDFTITEEIDVTSIVFFAYQTGSSLTSTINHVNYRIWDGVPDGGGSVIFGNTTTNMLASSSFSYVYRVLDTDDPGTITNRPIMEVVASAGFTLSPGTYWIDWQVGGSLASGPWAPPITINAQTTTGNGLQYDPNTTTWNPANDTGTLTQQGFPFLIFADESSGTFTVTPEEFDVVLGPGQTLTDYLTLTNGTPDIVHFDVEVNEVVAKPRSVTYKSTLSQAEKNLEAQYSVNKEEYFANPTEANQKYYDAAKEAYETMSVKRTPDRTLAGPSVPGNLTGAPTWQRPFSMAAPALACNGAPGLSSSGTNIQYHVIQFYSTVSEPLDVIWTVVAGGPTDGFFGLYCEPFDASQPQTNLMFADDDDGPVGFEPWIKAADNCVLAANTTYNLVVTLFQPSALLNGTYQVDFASSNIVLGPYGGGGGGGGIDWLTVSPLTGNLPTGYTSLEVEFDTEGLTVGETYNAEIVVTTYVPTEEVFVIPVTLTLGFTISGQLLYDGNNYPMEGHTIYLESLDVPDEGMISTVTDVNGEFIFDGLVNGEYHIWTPTDLGLPKEAMDWEDYYELQYLVKYPHAIPLLLHGLQNWAADLDGDGRITANDVMWMYRRLNNSINFFPIPDWLMSDAYVTIDGESEEVLLYGISAGDINSSYPGSIAKDGIMAEMEVPTAYGIEQNYPNPFNPTTMINYQLPETGMVQLTVYNMLGEQVATLVNEIKEAGYHAVQFDASNLSTGIYFYRIQAGDFVQTMKMMLVK